MAQKDIQDIASYMRQLDESKAAEEEACEEACKECEEQAALEYEELEDDGDVIDKASLGFIDDNDTQDESDDFYAEAEEKDTFEEDVSDCVEQEVCESAPTASIEVEVYNEDGFGEHFAKDLMQMLANVKAFAKKKLPNGDILVKVSGDVDDLEKAFAFYVGTDDFERLSPEDKEDFKARLVFDDGDTLAEADYREAVAHCLDPIGVNASTANLADQDTCALSIVKEEKARRAAKKILKCLKENDMSDLSDEQLDQLDNIKDAVDSAEGIDSLTPSELATWNAILATMGITQKEWDAMTPEQQDKFWAGSPANKPAVSRTGFAQGSGAKVEVYDPDIGGRVTSVFNPNYDMEHSMLQHPGAKRRQDKKDAELKAQTDKEAVAKQAMQKARGKSTWDVVDFAKMVGPLNDKQRKQLMNSLIADVEKDNASDAKRAGAETMFIKTLFGKKLTLRDFAKAWDAAPSGVHRFMNQTLDIFKDTMDTLGISGINRFKNLSEPKFQQFLELLKINMQGRQKGTINSGK